MRKIFFSFFISVVTGRQGNRQRMVRIPPLLIGIMVELGNQGVGHRVVAHAQRLLCAGQRRPSVTLTICPQITCLTCTCFRAPPNHANRFMTRSLQFTKLAHLTLSEVSSCRVWKYILSMSLLYNCNHRGERLREEKGW